MLGAGRAIDGALSDRIQENPVLLELCQRSSICLIAAMILPATSGVCLAVSPLAGVRQSPAPGATSPAPATAQRHLQSPFLKDIEKAEALGAAGKFDQAEEALRGILVKASEGQDVYGQARAHLALGWVFCSTAKYPAARSESELALALFSSLQDAVGLEKSNSLLGAISYWTGDLAAARDYYNKGLKIAEEQGMLAERASLLKGLARAGSPDPDKLLEQVLEIGRQIGNKYVQASALHDLGDNMFMRGQFDLAQNRLNQAAVIYQQVADRVDLARVLTSEGRVERAHGHPDKALKLYQQALDLQQQIGDREGAMQSINAMAVAYEAMNDYVKSTGLYERALAIARETGSPRLVNFELGNLAANYINLGKNREAIEILEGLLREGADPTSAPARYLSLSIAHLNLGQYHESIEAASKAIEAARTGYIEIVPRALYEKARAEAELGDQKAALADAGECLRTIEEMRKHLVPSDFMKRGFAGTTQDLFGLSIQLLTRANQPGRAVEVAEQARSRAFLDLLATREVQASPARQGQLASVRKLQQQMLSQGLDPSRPQPASPAELLTRGERTETSELWSRWVQADAELRSLASVEPYSLAQLQATARRLNSTVLSYWVSYDSTYMWVVSPSGAVRSARVDVPSNRLAELIGALWPGGRYGRRGNEAAAAQIQPEAKGEQADVSRVPTRGGAMLTLDGSSRRNWRELYRLLVQPVEQWLPRVPGSLLTIEPHGPLLMLPFAALRNAKGQYLIERFTLHYIPAVSLLGFTDKKKAIQAPPYYLLIADPSGIPHGDSSKLLPALAGARREASIVARLLPSSEVKLLEGREATERQVEELAGRSTVIHFATHGIIRDDQPFDSFLALGGSGWDLKHDGHFTAQKIYGLDLHADLVFLSACRSGLGQVSGDGMAGLTRAFLYAGTPSVIVTLWDVADEPTYRLVGAFYRSWLAGADKARALRSAQLKLLGEFRRGQVKLDTSAGGFVLPEDPVFWASFVLEGEP
jgi:CHAT domain-containing protein/tetratricopeptide (TPR) repeat protein